MSQLDLLMVHAACSWALWIRCRSRLGRFSLPIVTDLAVPAAMI
jgi:hypothetical protein